MSIHAVPRPIWVMLLILWGVWTSTALADDYALCRSAISMAEGSQHIPDAFLAAIARVESGRADPATGTLAAWPWTINAQGVGSFFGTKNEAVAAVRALQARGVRSIDVGCLQVNLLNHPEAFASLEEAFDPGANASYAGTFLLSLFARTRSWPLAAAAYHSQTPTIGAAYQRRVLAEWAVPDQNAGPSPPARPGPRTKSTFAWNGDTARETETRAGAPLVPRAISPVSALPGPAVGRIFGSTVRAAPPGGIAFTGRSLAAYRMMPTALAFRPPPKPS